MENKPEVNLIVGRDLFNDPSVLEVARILQKRRSEAVIGLIAVWLWDLNRGSTAPVTHADLDEAAHATGFGEAMLSAGWLTEEGKVIIPPYNGRRLGNKLRSERKKPCRVNPEDIPPPPALNSPEFRAKWVQWCRAWKRFNHGRSLPYGKAQAHLLTLEKLGLPAALQSIDLAIGRGWNNLYDPKEGIANGRQRPREEPGRVAAAPGQYDELALTEDDWREKMRARNPPPPEGG